ncbi:MAG: 2,4-dihydroxyhept-2-ene-1,7-dioic acid aldolase [Planctomycetota bacterium]|jgi:2-dehydro-3-deoxyglucarate aldolase/4-hydroxy-2-oxoheptanedioate aldolase|nr:2,4-dihydroxyhept-2-ene-1,7-dioic acid aldolase [Planctomycetota bacterium]
MLPYGKIPAREKMKSGGKLSAAWLHACSNMTAEVVAGAGFDVAVIDLEHGPGDIGCLVAQIQAMQAYPIVPFVRPQWNDFVQIKRILDAGAGGLFVPYVNTRQEAEAAVAAALYPPAGVRGMASSPRAAHFNHNPKEYLQRVNTEISIFIQIETPEAVANLDAILDIERLDGIVIGPMDLATNMGHFANPGAPEVQAAIHTIETATLAAEKSLATVSGGWSDAAEKYRRGYSLVMAMSDTTTLGQVGREIVASFKKEFAS